MRILIITQWFDPEPTFKGLLFAASLKSQGHEVEVLTGFPNYPGGKLYSGYKIKLFSREMLNGIRVNRLPLYPSHNSSGIQRILNYISFFLSCAIIGPFLVSKPDVVYVYNLPTLGFVAIGYRLFFGSKFVLDILDLWPGSVTKSGMLKSNFLLSLLDRVIHYIYHSADKITTISPRIKKILIARGIPDQKISLIYNWCNEKEAISTTMLPDVAKEFSGKFNVFYAGNMGKMQALESVIVAASIVWLSDKNIFFWFVGDGVEVENLKKTVHEQGLRNVQFIPRMKEDEIANLLTMSDLLLVHLKNDPLSEITIPSKIQAYMFASRPILIGVKGDAAQLIEQAGAGVVCEPENPLSIAMAIQKITKLSKLERNQMGENGRKYYMKYLSFEVGINKFIKVFNDALNS